MSEQGINPKDILGMKKPPLHLVPSALALWVSQIFAFSAKKYGPFNWREKPVRLTVYLDALERHLMALKDGQDIDEESGKPHMAHIAANAAIYFDAKALGCLVDDRSWKPGPAPEIVKQLTDSTPPAPPPTTPRPPTQHEREEIFVGTRTGGAS